MTGVSIYFNKGRSIFDWAIRWWTRSPYSHCAIVLTFDDGGSTLFEAQNNVGVRCRTVTPVVDLPATHWDHIDVPVSSESRLKVFAWCESELGCKYDWKGLFLAQVLRIPREHPDHWFCSELAAAALQQLGMLEGKRACTFSPGGLWRALTRGHA